MLKIAIMDYRTEDGELFQQMKERGFTKRSERKIILLLITPW